MWSGQLVKVILPEVLLQDVAAASALVVYHVNIPGITKFHSRSSLLHEHCYQLFQGLGENSLLHVFCAEAFLFYRC